MEAVRRERRRGNGDRKASRSGALLGDLDAEVLLEGLAELAREPARRDHILLRAFAGKEAVVLGELAGRGAGVLLAELPPATGGTVKVKVNFLKCESASMSSS